MTKQPMLASQGPYTINNMHPAGGHSNALSYQQHVTETSNLNIIISQESSSTALGGPSEQHSASVLRNLSTEVGALSSVGAHAKVGSDGQIVGRAP